MIGIYEIWIGDNYYHGSSKDMERRCIENHLYDLKRGAHGNRFMQFAYDKHKSFEWQVLVECAPDELFAYEQDFIDANWGLPNYMNLSAFAGRPPDATGITRTRQTKAKMIDAANKEVVVTYNDGSQVTFASHKDAAQALGVAKSTMSRWIKGKYPAYQRLGITSISGKSR